MIFERFKKNMYYRGYKIKLIRIRKMQLFLSAGIKEFSKGTTRICYQIELMKIIERKYIQIEVNKSQINQSNKDTFIYSY